MKLLVWAVIGVVVVMWFMRSKQLKPTIRPSGAVRGDDGQVVEKMVQCAHCGVHLPVSEAVSDAAGARFCSEEHRLQYAGPR